MGSTLATYYVELVLKGMENVQRGMEQIKLGLEKVDKVARVAQIGLAALTATVGGFVRAGLAGTGAGNMLTESLKSFSGQVASLFLPIINAVTARIQQLTEWMSKLSGKQQENIRYWIIATGVALGVLSVFPMVVRAIQAVIGSVYQLTAAIVAGEAATGIGLILPAIGFLVAGLAALAVGTEIGRSGLAALGDTLADVTAVPLMQAVRVLNQMAAALGPISDLYFEIVEALTPFRDALVGNVGNSLTVIVAALATANSMFLRLADAVFSLARPFIQLAFALTPLSRFFPDLTTMVAKFAEMIETVAIGIEIGLAVVEGTFIGFLETVIQGIARFLEKFAAMAEAIPFMGKRVAAELRAAAAAVRAIDLNPAERKDAGKGRDDVTPAGGQRERVQDIFTRLQSAALSKSPALELQKKLLDEAKERRRILEEIKRDIIRGRGAVPAVGP